MLLAQRLKDLRTEKGLSQSALADILGRTQQAIGKWEVGKSEPDGTTLLKLANYFNVSTDYLLGLSDQPHGGAGQSGMQGQTEMKAAEGAVSIGVATGFVKTGRQTIQAEPLTPEELSLLQAYRNASDRDKSIVDAVLKPSPPPKQHSPVCKDLERNKWIQSINNMYDSYYPLIDKLDYYSDFVHNQEEFSCLLEHPKMRELFEAAVTNQELRDRVPDNRGKKDNIAEALADVIVTCFDTFQADYMVPPEGETYLINKLKEYIP